MNILLSSLLAIVLMLVSATPVFALSERTELLKQQRQIQREMVKSRASPSRLSELKVELLDLQKAVKELRKKQAAERRAQVQLKRKSLKPVTLAPVTPPEQATFNVTESGKASYYAEKFNGRNTASGEIFSNALMTAAHKTLPFGTRVKVRNPSNGNVIEVIINDRGPFTPGRMIDLSSTAFSQLDNLSRGVIEVEIEVIKE